MLKSRRLIQLESRITFLEQNLLPPSNTTGQYTNKEQDLVRSFVLLVHAEIEAYFEDVAIERVNKSLLKWNSSRQRSACLTAVLAYSGNDLSYESESKTNSNNLAFRINRAVNHFLNLIQKNNGIKENNLLAILIPLGIEHASIDRSWLSTMDSFGSLRGIIAHHSSRSSLSVRTQIDRNTEVQRINQQIMPEVQRLDQLIRRLL